MLEADADPAGQTAEGEGEEEMGSRDLNAEVVRLTLELQEATEEKLQAARYGLVVLEESAALKMKHRQLEEEHEVLKGELQQLKEECECLEAEKGHLRDEMKEYKIRESRQLQDNSELEDENISLQKQVSVLKENQVEFESIKLELTQKNEEQEEMRAQLDEAARLKEIAERQLDEALEALKEEREQKNSLRRELSALTLNPFDSVGNLELHLEQLDDSQEEGQGGEGGVEGEERTRTVALIMVLGPLPVLLTLLTWGAPKVTASSIATPLHATATCSCVLQPLGCSKNQLAPRCILLLHRAIQLNSHLTQLGFANKRAEREKSSLVSKVEELQMQLVMSKQALSQQEDKVGSLTQQLEAVHSSQKHNQEGDNRGDDENGDEVFDYEVDTKSKEVLEARMRSASEELLKLRDELSQAGTRYNTLEQRYKQEKDRWRAEAQELADKIRQCIKSSKQDQERISELEKEIGATRKVANDSEGHLTVAQEELLAFSEELSNLYHHICVCNNLTPKRVTLDYYRDGARSGAGGSARRYVFPQHNSQKKPRANDMFGSKASALQFMGEVDSAGNQHRVSQLPWIAHPGFQGPFQRPQLGSSHPLPDQTSPGKTAPLIAYSVSDIDCELNANPSNSHIAERKAQLRHM
ncbi:Protein bicaudal D -like protein 2 [Collichthys lucidus]|uniref:Protein bicaudal D-like protein 2 n=1 Tax=Collichthys lucidus TaxID=240159 RepID=A0A4U5UNY5_COLLU|nr:Protein bicaudal D -like protein 2 [Collichthys lucidus]